MHAHDIFHRGRRVAAERRVAPLALPELGLFGEGQPGKVRKRANVAGFGPASASFAAWKGELAFRYSSCRRSFACCIAAVSSADIVSTAALK